MEKYSIWQDGEKLVMEDLQAVATLAGTVDDRVRAQLAQVPVEAGDRVGYVVPEVDGPLVVPNGASGTVLVKPFQMYRAPTSAVRDLLTAYSLGGAQTVPTPVPVAGNHRWDLLYAIISETDSDSANRLIEDPVTEVIGSSAVNTRHKGVVTLAWVQGTSTAQATDPYPAASWPALPAPAAGEAHVPLAYVHVFPSGAPATVTYSVDYIANDTHFARMNPQAGAEVVSNAGLARIVGATTIAATDDIKRIVTSTAGAWPLVPGGKRPPVFFESVSGGYSFWLHLAFGGATMVGATWTVFAQPIIDPTTSNPIHLHNLLGGDASEFTAGRGLRNRWFMGQAQLSCSTSTAWAHDQDSAAADSAFPTRMPRPGGAAGVFASFCDGLGNTIRANADFEAESTLTAGDWYCACMFRDLPAAGTASDMALLVRRSASGGGYVQGAMYVAAREDTPGHLDGRMVVAKIDVSPVWFPFSF